MEHFILDSAQNKLIGVINKKEDKDSPIILIVHGYFSSNKTGYNRLYYDIAKYLSYHKYITVRFDLSGMGESSGDLERIDFEDHVGDVLNVAKHIYKNHKKKIILIGHSLGCLLSLQAYIDFPDLFEKIVLISPLYFDDIVMSRFFDCNMIKELEETGKTCRKGIIVNYSFFNNKMSLINVAKRIKICKIPIIILIGDSDPFFSKTEILKLQKVTSIIPIVVPKGDHNFSNKSTRNTLLKKITFSLDH